VIDNLKGRERVEFLDLFQDVTSRSLVVLTFLSILELMKRKLIKCQQALPGSIIHIFPVGNFDDLGNTSFEEDYAYDAPKDASPEEPDQEQDEEPEDKLDEPL
jgi:chromatin segregation and condensation protein Rec8/ScpA/Scc1 (kleisin family)